MKNPSEVPERIAITGNFGTGKTEAAVSIAKWLRDTDTPGTVYIINAERDGSVQRANERYTDWRSNITFQDVNGWVELTGTTGLYVSMATTGDWIVLDGLDKAWTWVRDLYVETENRKAGHQLDPSDPFAMLPTIDMDWETINAAYFRWFNSLIVGAQPAHLLLVGPSQPLKVATDKTAWGDTKETLDLLSHHGVRWAGQKRAGFDVQTLLLAKVAKAGYTLTTMKDAGGRPYLSDTPVVDFVSTYLIDCGGWAL